MSSVWRALILTHMFSVYSKTSSCGTLWQNWWRCALCPRRLIRFLLTLTTLKSTSFAGWSRARNTARQRTAERRHNGESGEERSVVQRGEQKAVMGGWTGDQQSNEGGVYGASLWLCTAKTKRAPTTEQALYEKLHLCRVFIQGKRERWSQYSGQSRE